MTYRQATRKAPRRIPRSVVVGLLVVAAAIGSQLLAPSSPTAASPIGVLLSSPRATPSPIAAPPTGVIRRDQPGAPSSTAAPPTGVIRGDPRAALGEPAGAVPAGTTVFDNAIPGVAKLDPALLGALRRAATDAARGGVEIYVDSGWRSPSYQAQLLRQAISQYGSEREAARWVATPTTSPHVSGNAVDIGPASATAWLSAHGARYGLCQIYRNEPWHYELRPAAVGDGCPPMYADPTQDPRMQQ